jgi:ribonuclease P protein component
VPRQGLQKKERLIKTSDIKRISISGKKIEWPAASLSFLKRKPADYSRIAVIASGKLGKSFLRNKMKRYVREIFRREKNNFETGLDLVVRLKAGAEKSGYHKFYLEFKRQLGKTGVFG